MEGVGLVVGGEGVVVAEVGLEGGEVAGDLGLDLVVGVLVEAVGGEDLGEEEGGADVVVLEVVERGAADARGLGEWKRRT